MRAFFALFLLAWLLGIALGVAHVPVVWPVLVGVLGGLTVMRLRWRLPYALAVAALVLLGFARVHERASVAQDHCTFSSGFTGQVVEPVLIEEDRLQVVIKDARGCRVLVYADRFSEIQVGDDVQITGGAVKTLADAREYSAGYAAYLEGRGISGTRLYPTITTTPRLRQVADGGQASRSLNLHKAMRDQVTKVFTEPAASLTQAMLFAEDGTIPEEIVERFRITGISHILAISGFNISLLAGLLLGILLLLPLSPWVRTGVLIGFLWVYIAFIGAPTSALRAVVFWTIALLALRLNLLVSLPTVLLLGSAILVSFEPQYLGDIGWQLSVSAVAGIWLMLFLMRPVLKGRPGGVDGALRWFLTLFLASLGAMLATTPIILYHFETLALGGLVTNLLVVPVVPALTVLQIAALSISFVFMPLALLIAYSVQLIIAWLDGVTGVIAAVPYLFWEQVALPWWAFVLYYAALVTSALLVMQQQRRTWREMWG